MKMEIFEISQHHIKPAPETWAHPETSASGVARVGVAHVR